MSLKRIVDMDLKHNLGLSMDEVKSVSNVATASMNDDELINVINKHIDKLRSSNPLETEAEARKQEDFKKCFVCGSEGEPATLLNDREIFYCKKHHVAIPKRVKN